MGEPYLVPAIGQADGWEQEGDKSTRDRPGKMGQGDGQVKSDRII